MGSFLISCGLSGQAISEGVKCAVIPVSQSRTFAPADVSMASQPAVPVYGVFSSICHPDSFWSPLGAMITGTYNDYGRILPEDTPLNRIAMTALFLRLLQGAPVVSQGENPYHDVPYDLVAFLQDKAPALGAALAQCRAGCLSGGGLDFQEFLEVWDYTWEAADEARLFCVDGYGAQIVRPVQFCAVHHLTVDYLVDYAANQTGWDGSSHRLEDVLASIVEAEKASPAEPGTEGEDPERSAWKRSWRVLDALRSTQALSGADGRAPEFPAPFKNDAGEILIQHLDGKITFAEAVEQIRPLYAGRYLYSAMDALNLKYSPIEYAGQDYDNEQGRARAKFISVVAKKASAELKKMYR